MMSRELDALRKRALLTLEIDPDTKPQVTNTELTKFVQDVKKITTRKRVVILVVES
jgi:hypothetical protein